jgi:hypothetical protein
MNQPRRLSRLDKKALLQVLAKPIRANQSSIDERELLLKHEKNRRIEAAFALYDIPEHWDELLRWRELALCLMARCFAGCRTVGGGRGGPARKYPEKIIDRQHAIFDQFSMHKVSHPDWSEARAALHFFYQHTQDCQEARLNKPKSLIQAMRRIGNISKRAKSRT